MQMGVRDQAFEAQGGQEGGLKGANRGEAQMVPEGLRRAN